jgi:hypothetical protein
VKYDALIEAMNNTKLPLKLHVHPPTENVLNHKFGKIINAGFNECTQWLLSSIPLQEIAGQVHSEAVVVPRVITKRRRRRKRPHASSPLEI